VVNPLFSLEHSLKERQTKPEKKTGRLIEQEHDDDDEAK
jgi:hypothetical protein